jgi:hypothetical protein
MVANFFCELGDQQVHLRTTITASKLRLIPNHIELPMLFSASRLEELMFSPKQSTCYPQMFFADKKWMCDFCIVSA